MNPEKHYFDRVVGAAPEDQTKLEAEVSEEIEKYGGGKLEELELEKTDEEQRLLETAEVAAEKYLKQYGRTSDLVIPAENVHVLKAGGVADLLREAYARSGRKVDEEHTEGISIPALDAMYLERDDSPLRFSLRAFHEFYHLKNYRALQRREDTKHDAYHAGFSVTSRDGKTTYFHDVEEALTAYVERKFFDDELSQDPAVSAEVAKYTEPGQEPPFSYSDSVQKFNRLVDTLWKANEADYPSRDDVVRLFLEAQATGRLLKVAHLVERTYGHGSFRRLGERTAEKR